MKDTKAFKCLGLTKGYRLVALWKGCPPMVIAKEFKWAALKDCGDIMLFTRKPVFRLGDWEGACVSYGYRLDAAVLFSGDIRDSLIRVTPIDMKKHRLALVD